MTTQQTALVLAMVDKIGVPYLYDGKGMPGRPGWNGSATAREPYFGFDCSGFVTSCLAEIGGPDWRITKNAQMLFDSLPVESEPGVCSLCLYGSSDDSIHHVMVILNTRGAVIGSHGGDRDCITEQRAAVSRAGVSLAARVRYRSDFRGFRRVPFLFA